MVPPIFPRIHLASRSPRRRELLAQVGIPFDLLAFRTPPREDPESGETPLPDENPVDYVQRVARAKAVLGWKTVLWRKLPHQPVLSADTTLEFDGEIIGKPQNADDARRILHRLSGQTHRVLTAICLVHGDDLRAALSVSEVRFARLDDAEIRAYVDSGEPMDKAGAYGIQGRAAAFVEHLSGSYSGVMGLPLHETVRLLRGFMVAA